jgi:hypothetical protein
MARRVLAFLEGEATSPPLASTVEETLDETAAALHRLGSCLVRASQPTAREGAPQFQEQVLGMRCLEIAHRVWAPLLPQLMKDITRAFEALERALLSQPDEDGAVRHRASIVRGALVHLTTGWSASDRATIPTSPYWRLGQVLIAFGPDLGLSTVNGTATSDRQLQQPVRRAESQLRQLLERAGRICRFVASTFDAGISGGEVLDGAMVSTSAEEAAARRHVAAELSGLSGTIDRALAPGPRLSLLD